MKSDAEKTRERTLKRNFNLSLADYETIDTYQKHGCAICGRYPKKLRLSVDHRHDDGLVRGLLCSFCNRGIEMFKERADIMAKAVTYLERPPAVVALGERRYGYAGRTGTKRQTAVLRRAYGRRGRA